MAYCKSCSAPLKANNNHCEYCNVRNDVDLAIQYTVVVTSPSDLMCPHCDINLDHIHLNTSQTLKIGRCHQCFGLFLRKNDIDLLLKSRVPKVKGIYLKQIQAINKDRYQFKPVKYIKCPQCQAMMARSSFAYRSGVVIDRCRQHGIWLDNGEITHLMEWRKAGGQLLHQQQQSKNKKKHPKIYLHLK